MKYFLITSTAVLSIFAVAGCFPKIPTLPDLPEVLELPEVKIPTIAPDNVLPELPVTTSPTAGSLPGLK